MSILILFTKCSKESIAITLQTHHVCFTLKWRRNDAFHIVSTWNTRGVFLGKKLITVNLVAYFNQMDDTITFNFVSQKICFMIFQRFYLLHIFHWDLWTFSQKIHTKVSLFLIIFSECFSLSSKVFSKSWNVSLLCCETLFKESFSD